MDIFAKPYGTNVVNPDYDFDKNNLGNIEVWINGEKRDDVTVIDYYNSAWRCIDVSIPVSVTGAHTHSLTLVPQVDAKCGTDGTKAYYSCSCGKYFEDEMANVEITNFDTWKVIPATGEHTGGTATCKGIRQYVLFAERHTAIMQHTPRTKMTATAQHRLPALYAER